MRATMSSSNIGMQHHDDHATAHLVERTLVHTMATVVGIFFVFLAFGGFVYPDYLGMHLNTTHSLIHLVSGAAAMYFGLFGTTSGASLFCVTMGAIYGALALAGFAFGAPGEPTLGGTLHIMDTQLIRIIPGTLELGASDHVLHLLLGAVFIVSGFLGWLGTDEEHP